MPGFIDRTSSKKQLVHFMLLALIAVMPAQKLSAQAAQSGSVNMEYADMVYASVQGLDLALDIYMPENVVNPPLVVFMHGGAWQFGNKRSEYPVQFVEHGFAVAGLDFRQSTQARFPAQAHDIKAAVRYLRANAGRFGFNADRIAISGYSSGAHLATLVGVTNGHTELEGNLGDYLDTSSDVQAIISYYGAHDLTSILGQSTDFGLGVRVPALQLLLGAQPVEVPDLAQLASPVFHVDEGDPPLLLFHGDEDIQMPIDQSYQMDAAYKALGLDVYFDVVEGAAHGGSGFFAPDKLERALDFLKRTIAN